MGTHGATNYYQLPTFQFYTYDDLYNLAKQCGYTGTEATTPTATDWTALTSYISTARKLSDNNVVSTATNGEAFVIASRRYHKFLSTDGKGNFHSADRITTSSIFIAETETETNGVRVFSNAYHGGEKSFTLYYANNGHDADFKLQNGKNYLCVDNNGVVSITTRSDNEKLAKLDDEWVIKPTPYNSDEKVPFLNINKTDIQNVKNWYFRIENNKKRIKLIDVTDPTGDNTAGYLNDVDKTAAATFDGVQGTTIHLADMFSNSVDLRTAANVWHVSLAAPGSEDEDSPIGIVNNFTHSLYYIQNANSKKYIGEPSGTSQLMPLISENADKSSRALFYFLPKDDNNDKGEYAMMLLDRTNSTTTETPKGWLDIADTGENGKPNSDATPNLTQAGLVYRSFTSSTTKPSDDDAYNWSLHRARYIEARTAASANFNGYRYVTLWFPFDIMNTDEENVKLYTARWNSDYSGIVTTRIQPGEILPAKHGALALITDDDKFKTVKFEIATGDADSYPADIDNDILLGIAESEDYILGDADDTDKHIYNRNNIYVFSVTRKNDGGTYTDENALCLGHPADDYLMANRCYVKATAESEAQSSKGKILSVSFDSTDGITDINTTPSAPKRYFDLQGREVSHPQHGIYITNGKKIYLK